MPSLLEWKVPAAAQPRPSDYGYDLERALSAVVGLHTIIPPDAFTADTLGSERAGNGVLIDNGLVLTIGYLITEAEQVWLHLGDGRGCAAAGTFHSSSEGMSSASCGGLYHTRNAVREKQGNGPSWPHPRFPSPTRAARARARAHALRERPPSRRRSRTRARREAKKDCCYE